MASYQGIALDEAEFVLIELRDRHRISSDTHSPASIRSRSGGITT